jgi:D-alanyl-D-alanine carboxypeptidase/D-alanyl-D-alanine-endopeptidase (penicillin-binding protein 4)
VRFSTGTVTAFLALATVAGCAPSGAKPVITASAPSSARPSSRIDQLQRDLRAIFTATDVDHANWSIAVKSLTTGETLFAMNANRMLTPASNQKLITAAVAAERLGWDYRYSTRIYATGPIANGDLDGDLVVVSNGDPTINRRHPERWAAFDAWAKQLYDKGVRRVGGQLIGDDSAFAEPGWGTGWAWDDLSVGYGAAVGALQYNENAIELSIGPGLEAGSRAIISVSPPGSGIILNHAVTTVAADQPSRIGIDRIPGSNQVTVSGQMAIGARAVSAEIAAPNPTLLYLSALRDALARNGVFVGGNPLDIDDARVGPDYSNATLLLEDHSSPLASIIDANLKWSLNEYSETMLRSIAAMPSEATADAGLEKLRETLQQWGISSDLYVARDGSGLSRNDYVAPDALVALLAHVWKDDKLKSTFQSTLPQAAVSGTIANRMKNTLAAERVWAKTGSMSNVRSLSGYLMTLDNEPMVFSFISNGYHVADSRIDAVMDEALVRLVQFPRDAPPLLGYERPRVRDGRSGRR